MIQYQILKTNIMTVVRQTVTRITNEILGVKGSILPKVLCLFDLKGRGTSKRNDTVFFNFEITESNNWDTVISLISLSRYRRFRKICTICCSFCS